MFFLEGIDFIVNIKVRSDKFVVKSSLEFYEYVFYLRIVGFLFLVEKMRESTGIFLFKNWFFRSLFVKLLKYFEWLKIILWYGGESIYSFVDWIKFIFFFLVIFLDLIFDVFIGYLENIF